MKLPTVKPKIGIYGLTGCAGCQLTILFRPELLDIATMVDISAFPFGKENNDSGPLDIIFVEGLVAHQKDLDLLNKLRERAKVLVAMGACAVHACTPGIKNFIAKGVEDKVYTKTDHLHSLDPSPIDKHVKVDYYVKGCPVDREEIVYFIKQFMLGKKPVVQERSLCYVCNLKENHCLLEQNRECLGPLIDGNCSIICPTRNLGCTGCRGPIADSNIKAWLDLMKEKGFEDHLMQQRLQKYAGLRFEEFMKEQGLLEEGLHEERKKLMIQTLKKIKEQELKKVPVSESKNAKDQKEKSQIKTKKKFPTQQKIETDDAAKKAPDKNTPTFSKKKIRSSEMKIKPKK
jgi:sulfhydrogenase subunit delta